MQHLSCYLCHRKNQSYIYSSDGFHLNIWNHWQLNCLLNSLLILTTREIPKFYKIGPLWGEPLMSSGFPSQRVSNEESTRHHGLPSLKRPVIQKCLHVMKSHVCAIMQSNLELSLVRPFGMTYNICYIKLRYFILIRKKKPYIFLWGVTTV